MVVISGNIMLMARAVQMVCICSPPSGATPAGSARSNTLASTGTGALAASNSAWVELAGVGGLAGAVVCTEGAATGFSSLSGGSELWARIMAREITSKAAIASQRPRPLANTFLRTNSTLISRHSASGNVGYLCVPIVPGHSNI